MPVQQLAQQQLESDHDSGQACIRRPIKVNEIGLRPQLRILIRSSRLAEIEYFISDALRVFFLGKVPRTVNHDTLITIGKEFFFSG